MQKLRNGTLSYSFLSDLITPWSSLLAHLTPVLPLPSIKFPLFEKLSIAFHFMSGTLWKTLPGRASTKLAGQIENKSRSHADLF